MSPSFSEHLGIIFLIFSLLNKSSIFIEHYQHTHCMLLIHELKAIISINHVQKALYAFDIIKLIQRFTKTIMFFSITIYERQNCTKFFQLLSINSF